MGNKLEAQRIPAQSIENISTWQIPELSGEHVVYINDSETTKKAALPSLREPAAKQVETRRIRMSGSELDDMIEKARQEGYAKGLAEGHVQGVVNGEQEGRDSIRDHLEETVSLLEKASINAPQVLRFHQEQVQKAIVALVEKISSAIIGRELSVANADLLQLVTDLAVNLDDGESVLRVYVNPEDCTLLLEHAQGQNWQWVADESISAGGCKVETNFSDIDASIEQRLTDATAGLYAKMQAQESQNV